MIYSLTDIIIIYIDLAIQCCSMSIVNFCREARMVVCWMAKDG